MLPEIQIGDLTMDGKEPVFILGPCAIESEEFAWEMARALKAIADEQRLRFVFKASYDKANRTSVKSFRGPGVREGCRILGEIGKDLGVPVTTDVHTPEEAEIAAESVDLLQVPAFLCRQTDLIVATAKTGRAMNVKKGQFLAPWDMRPVAEKIESSGCLNFFFTERGASFGYNTLVRRHAIPLLDALKTGTGWFSMPPTPCSARVGKATVPAATACWRPSWRELRCPSGATASSWKPTAIPPRLCPTAQTRFRSGRCPLSSRN